MKQRTNTIALGALLFLCLLWTQQTPAQGYGDPLTLQGLGHTTSHSSAARGSGGITFGIRSDASLMFLNPASLASVRTFQLSLGGMQQSAHTQQEQHYGGLQTHAAFAPLVEGTTGSISDPDTNAYYNGTKVTLRTQADSVQRPFDAIGPNWSSKRSKGLPVQVLVAAPFTVGGLAVVGGVGVVEYANLRWYYQNNNCFSPAVLSLLNGTISTSGLDRNPYAVQWYQYKQQREGSIYGYGAALSGAVSEQLSVGVSAMLLKGSTDDMEERVGRGRMLFFTSSLRLDQPGTTSYKKTGTSDYSGTEFTLGAEYASRYFCFGFSVQAPSTIKRSFATSFWQDSVSASKRFLSKDDSVHVTATGSYSGEDKIELPLRGSVGFGLKLRENLTFGITYEIRPYASAQYTGTDRPASNPWLSSSVLHIGGEYIANSWLVLRGGVTNYQEVFQPLTAAIRGEPVNYPVYALGCGITLAGAVLNVTYEYSDMKYVDAWANAVSINRQFTNSIVVGFSYEFAWMK